MINKKSIFFLTIIVIFCRIFFFVNYENNLNKLSYPDEINYYESGATQFKELGFNYFFTERSLYNGPINILWVSFFTEYKFNKITNIVLMGLSAYLVFLITSFYSSKLISLLSFVAFTSYPSFNHFSKTILTEPPFIFLLYLSIFTAIYALKNNSKLLIFIAGLIFSLATLTRPTTQYFPFFIMFLYSLAYLINLRLKLFENLRFTYLSYFLAGFLLLSAPWFIKNKMLFDKLGISNGSGAVLYLGNDWRKKGDEPFYSNMHFDTYEHTAPYSHLDTKGDLILTNKAKEFIKKDPIYFIQNTILKSFKIIFGYPKDYFGGRNTIFEFMSYPDSNVFYSNVIKLLLHPLSGLLIVISFFSFPKNELSFFLQSLILYFIVIHSITFPIPRLFLPALGLSFCFLGVIFNSRKKFFLTIPVYLSVILFLSFSRVNYSDIIDAKRLKFFELKNIEVKETISNGLNKDGSNFYLLKKSANSKITYKVKPFLVGINKVLIFKIKYKENSLSLGKVRDIKVSWKFKDKDIIQSKILKTKAGIEGSYLISPSLFNKDWSSPKSKIELITLNIRSENEVKLKIDSILLGN